MHQREILDAGAGAVYEDAKGHWLKVLRFDKWWESFGDHRPYVDYTVIKQGESSKPAVGGVILLKTFAKRCKRVVSSDELKS